MKKIYTLIAILLVTTLCLRFTSSAYAIDDPFARPNNFIGIHILFPSELDQAKDLVNSNGGQWGYVTIPIQIGDRDLEKWQAFMDETKKLHVIPIIRLATQPDPHNTAVWRKPTPADILDFANFLSSLSWPTQNKYVILFNEVNRFDEWGGEYPNPGEYEGIVSYAHQVFKQRDPNFYLILSGMDASAPNDGTHYINGFTYLQDLVNSTSVTSDIDGFSSHSYPNPGFSSYPSDIKKVGVATYKYEYALLNQNAAHVLPVFITETGWSDNVIPQDIISKYYQMTFSDIWDKDRDKIVAITPFLLNASGGPFDQFSFYKNGTPTDFFKTFISMVKTKGSPVLNTLQIVKPAEAATLKTETFTKKPVVKQRFSPLLSLYFKTIFGIR